ncbi:MAG: PfkB family carbohydrate kinase [Brumimicrobium sp.]
MELETLFEKFNQARIVVLGDVMIDSYLYGKVSRVSPEAPVPIINFKKEEQRLGGAANVALNLLSLEAKVSMVTVIGDDNDGNSLLTLLKNEGISTKGVVRSKNRQTTVKERVVGNHQQLLRIDKEQTNDISFDEENQLLEELEVLLKEGQDAIILQDYNKGVLTERLISEVVALAKKYHTYTTVDPKLKNFLAYKGVTLFKPNLKELSEGLQMKIDFARDRESFDVAIQKLDAELGADLLFVTLSEYGVYIQAKQDKHYIEAHKRNIHDVSGAGDTVISVATLCLCAGLSPKSLAKMANLAGGIVCEYSGVVAIQKEQLLSEAKRKSIELD